MNNIVELNGLQGVKSEKVYAYFSTEPKEVQNALELGIACTGLMITGRTTFILTMKKTYAVNTCSVVSRRSLKRWKQ